MCLSLAKAMPCRVIHAFISPHKPKIASTQTSSYYSSSSLVNDLVHLWWAGLVWFYWKCALSTSDAHLPPVKAFGMNGMSENLAPVI